MSQRGLELAHQKREAVLITNRRAYVPPSLFVGGHQITIGKKLRYLVVILDKFLTFAPHIDMVANKASRSAAALARLMPNVRGPGQRKRRLLSTVVESQLLYAALVWATRVSEIARTRANLICPQRSAVLRLNQAYRTVYAEAALVLACMPPLDVLSLERLRIRDRLNTAHNPGELHWILISGCIRIACQKKKMSELHAVSWRGLSELHAVSWRRLSEFHEISWRGLSELHAISWKALSF
ncbi:uncharacterized protein LOC132945575 [Metopolophium dirhodum]|uniref:uncharacterized protein LOC132945575 n=1 Tax=Metopolophium dirhodum TaxID=44670 RepID=UPI0029901212|nr:uncharacterized protein LOC132945575 [Metopolophium dirhodum]